MVVLDIGSQPIQAVCTERVGAELFVFFLAYCIIECDLVPCFIENTPGFQWCVVVLYPIRQDQRHTTLHNNDLIAVMKSSHCLYHYWQNALLCLCRFVYTVIAECIILRVRPNAPSGANVEVGQISDKTLCTGFTTHIVTHRYSSGMKLLGYRNLQCLCKSWNT